MAGFYFHAEVSEQSDMKLMGQTMIMFINMNMFFNCVVGEGGISNASDFQEIQEYVTWSTTLKITRP